MSIIFTFVWKWVFVLPLALVTVLLKAPVYGRRFIKILGSYILASLTGLLTLIALSDNSSGWALLFFPFMGAFVIFIGLVSNTYEKQKEAMQTQDWGMMQILREDSAFDLLLMLGTVLFYIVVLFLPLVADNLLIKTFFFVIDWTYNLPIIGWIIAIGGLLFLLNTLIHAIFTFGAIAVGISSLFGNSEPVTENAVTTDSERESNPRKLTGAEFAGNLNRNAREE